MEPTTDEAQSSLRVQRPSKTLRQLTLDKMREAILNGHFQPGERLVERDLCAQLGVSRTIVREVLRHLESEGLVANVSNRGPIVAETSSDEAWQIYQIRAVLEAMAAQACASSPDERTTDSLRLALVDIESAYALKDPARVLEGTAEFYEILFRSAGLTIAWDVVSSLTLRINRLRSMTIKEHNRSTEGPREMRAIVEAISRGDPDAAADAARAHVLKAASIARGLLDQRDAEGR